MNGEITAAGVVVDKPWYLSKKVWLCAIALALAILQSGTGRWSNVTNEQLIGRIAETASFVLPLVGTILAIAHVDAKTRAAALMADAIRAASELNHDDEQDPVQQQIPH